MASGNTKNEIIIIDSSPEAEININKPTPPKKKRKIQPQKKSQKKDTKKKKKRKKPDGAPPGYERVRKELQGLLLNPPIGITACPVDSKDILTWIASIDGPSDTPYHGGRFYLNIKFGDQYPFEPPKVLFKTKIYHCNIRSDNGEI